ncbi:MAG: glycerol-3-phosphate 1-O-acyltransferase PlsY [candidate division WOR-3 bacterium]
MNAGRIILSIFIGFLFGSIPFGYLAGLINRIDIRKKGSGNIGFTNVQRILGLKWAVPVLILDIAKGIVPVIFAQSFRLLAPLVGLGAILGHIFTPYLKFNGGKGVATSIGVAAIICPRSLLPSVLVLLLILLITGFVSLSSLCFSLSLPVFTLIFYQGNLLLLVFALCITILIFIRHLPNINRLINRTEPKFGLWLKLFSKTE